MSSSKKYHVSLDDLSRWNDAASKIPGILDLLRLLHGKVFGNNIIPANTLFDIFSDTVVDVGTAGIPFDNITVGATDLDGPFNYLMVIESDSGITYTPSDYYTGFRVGSIVVGDADDLDPIDNIIVGSTSISGPFHRVKANADVFIISNI
mgnify:CR=1 FL=1